MEENSNMTTVKNNDYFLSTYYVPDTIVGAFIEIISDPHVLAK